MTLSSYGDPATGWLVSGLARPRVIYIPKYPRNSKFNSIYRIDQMNFYNFHHPTIIIVREAKLLRHFRHENIIGFFY
jgi:hypothetical protein